MIYIHTDTHYKKDVSTNRRQIFSVALPPLPFIKIIHSSTADIDGLGAALSVLFQNGTLPAVEGVAGPRMAADDATTFVRAKVALVTNAHGHCRSDMRIAHGASSVASVAKFTHCCSGLFATYDQIRMMSS